MTEFVDVYTVEREKTDKILPRKDIFSKLEPDERIFLVHVCIFNRYGEMLIQHRLSTKDKYPDLWDVSAGGFVQSGEDSQTAVLRELKEELGITSSSDNLKFVCCEPFSVVFDDFYTGYCDLPSSDFKFQRNEISEVRWADYSQVMGMISSNEFVDYSPELIKLIFNHVYSDSFHMLKNPCESQHCDISAFASDSAVKALAFHENLHGYQKTPLHDISKYYSENGIGGVYIKDESYRFNLNAFKALGGSYAVGCLMDSLNENSVLITATDGNHGRSVAWAAHTLGIKCKVYLPKGTATERVENIRLLGADAQVLDLSYDDCVRTAKNEADENGYVLVQDTAWKGYEDIPSNIMKGYLTMALEAVLQLGEKIPTHIFLQAGVGSMASALTAFFTNYYSDKKPKIIIVEPNNADCVYATAHANDSVLHSCVGDLDTIMAGLACGEVSSVAWPVLRDYADYFVSMPDSVATNGMKKLNEFSITSGESGCAGFAAFREIVVNPLLSDFCQELGLNSSSIVLCFSTEGATDKTGYSRVINGEEH